MSKVVRRPTLCAVLAALFYALNTPLSKLLLGKVSSAMLAALLYLGAGLGVGLLGLCRRRGRSQKELPLTRRDLPWTVGMVVLDIAAPIFLMMGLRRTTAANAALLNNFEIAATALLAAALFREAISRRLWAAIGLVSAASILLSLDGADCLHFSSGSALVLLACACWGLENNCTKKLSGRDPLEIVVIKGVFSGGGALFIALGLGERLPAPAIICSALLLGFAAYGLSIYFYIYAQRGLGAAKTSAYYALAPFAAALLSLAVFQELPGLRFWIALGIMLAGAYLASVDPIDNSSACSYNKNNRRKELGADPSPAAPCD